MAQLMRVTVTLDVVSPGDRGDTGDARDAVTNALVRIVSSDAKGMVAITGASVDRVERVA
jgi:hypothetical protein